MLNPLFRKELRELLPLALVGIVAQLYFVGTAMGMQLGPLGGNNRMGAIPFVSEETSGWFFYVAGTLALALGLWQTLLESTRGTFQFLLHRPISREKILGTKLLVGGATCLVIAVLPVAVYSLWAATPGTHTSPFLWSMTAWAWHLCVEMPVVYLGAFLSGLRPARWFGSRFLPLAAAVFVLAACQVLSAWWWLTLPASVAVAACFVLVILDVGGRRDFS